MSGYSLRKRKKAPIVEMSEEEIEEVEEPAPTKKRAAPKEGGRRGRKKKEEGVEEKEKKALSKKEAATKKEESTKSSEEMKSTETTEKAPEELAKKEEEPEKKDESAEPPRAEEKTTETAATTSDAEKQTELLEHGHIYFFYRPKLGVESASGIEDVQKLYIILAPDGSPNKRVITLPKKSLPDVKTHGRHFAFVDMVTEKWDESLEEALGTADYKTKTRGARHLEGARPCGAGNYGIVKHASGHTHLAFVVELPDEMGEVQEAFDIPKEGSYVITIKNPLKPGAIKLSEKTVELPEDLQGKFGDKKFIPVNPVELLNHEGMELILIGAREDIVEELGAPGEEERIEAKKLTDTDVFKDLHLKRKDHPPSALISGEWK